MPTKNKKTNNDKTLVLIVTIFVVGLVISKMLFVSFYNTPKVSARNLDIIKTPTEVPTPPRTRPDYTCPISGWIDCMPSVETEKTYRECTPTYIEWVKTSCPGFKGIAY